MPGYLPSTSTLKSSRARLLLGTVTACGWLLLATSPAATQVPPFPAHEIGSQTAQPRQSAGIDHSPAEWLQRLFSSTNQYSYRGILTHQYGSQAEALRMTYGRVAGEEYERLEHLDGDAREIIRHGDYLTRLQPNQDRVYFHQPLSLTLYKDLDELEQHYRVCSQYLDRVAGRPAVVMVIEPRDALRYGYRLTLDRDTAILLGWEWLGSNKRVLERFRFAAIDIDATLAPEWIVMPHRQAEQASRAAEVGRALATDTMLAWRPTWLPSGFDLAVPVTRPDDPVQTYSDGLAAMTIFVEPVERISEYTHQDGSARRGATVAYLHHAQLNGSHYRVTVLGEVPRATARQVAQSVMWQGAEL